MMQKGNRTFFRGVILSLAAVFWLTALNMPCAAASAAREDEKDDLRIEQLEYALKPDSPGQAAEYWAKSMATRNGALRFAMLSDTLRQKYRQGYVDGNWVIGCSSPWVESYQVVFCGNSGETYSYEIDYVMTDSTNEKINASETVTVQKEKKAVSPDTSISTESRWCVTAGNDLGAMDFPLH